MKFRIGGYAGLTIQKLGGVPSQIAPGDIYPALKRGTIDAAELIGPYDDEKAKEDARNPAALRRLPAGGAELRAFSQPIMEACLKASNHVNAETAAANADFKKVLESMQAFRDAALQKSEIEKWWPIIKAANIKFE